ncbi:MAG TPA: Na+/H+ antiporter NhaA [Syntrophorhabdaceae bacterium]|jgi:NhaA family Na+:H+ antiporter
MGTELTKIFQDFVKNEKTGGFVLVFSTLASILVTNTPLGVYYRGFWDYNLQITLPFTTLSHSIAEWINDGVMTVFFLLVGLEIERELYAGELAQPRKAVLPVMAAIGGMVVPALIHLAFNTGAPTQAGFAVPMATDIAFSLGVLSLLGRRVPVSLKVVLTALAIIDDLGAILIIAFFYVRAFSCLSLACALAIFALLIALNRLNNKIISIYLVAGVFMWFFMLKSGVHPTITGVLLAFAIPYGKGNQSSPSYKVERFLDRPVPLIIVPLFVLANTAILFSPGWYETLMDRNTWGIFLGLLLGKPVGIMLFAFLAVKLGMGRLPGDLGWRHIVGMGLLGGIGFTMSIFITNLAFGDPVLVRNSKVAVLAASVAASLCGLFLLYSAKRIRVREGR